MIEQYYKNPKYKEPPPYTATNYQHGTYYMKQAEKYNCTVSEYLRRDDKLRKLIADSEAKQGQTCWPRNKDDYEKYGCCTIVGLIHHLDGFAKDEVWPDDDNPYIIHAKSNKTGETMNTTSSYFTNKAPSYLLC